MATDLAMQDNYGSTPEYESGDFEHEPSFSVNNVYEIASDIGKDFEILIDTYGVDSIHQIMPKVIGALEQLERLASQAETLEDTISEYKLTCEQLEREKRQKAADRIQYERDLEAIEERMRQENQELRNVIVRLKEENKRLNLTLRHSDSFHNILDRGHPDGEESDKCSKMALTVEKLQQQLSSSDSQIASKSADYDNALAQIERLAGLNKDLRRKIKHSQASIRSTAEEKAELQASLQVHRKEINTLKCQLKLLKKELNVNVTNRPSTGSSASTDDELSKTDSNVKGEESDSSKALFTATELKDIIWERNELKTKVSDLTDVISALKQNDLSDIDVTSKEDCFYSEPPEGPLQGPLPEEPLDAPWRRSESGVRSFFRKLFGSAPDFGFLQ